jgi:hypothetical protein
VDTRLLLGMLRQGSNRRIVSLELTHD